MRFDDWHLRLIEYLSFSARKAFQPGLHDCALFSAGAVAAMTGVDFAANWRGRYTTLSGGARLLRRAGHDDHIALAAACLKEIAPAFAAPGDLAVLPQGGAMVLGVVQGERVYVLTQNGLGLLHLSDAARAFRVN